MKLTVVTNYENMTDEMIEHWCKKILESDPSAGETIRRLKDCGIASVTDKDPDPKSEAKKTTTFYLGDWQ